MPLYHSLLRKAAPILFVVAVLDLVLSTGYILMAFFSQMAANPYASPQPAMGYALLGAIEAGIGKAVLPFIGAALVWRADKILQVREAQQ